MTRQSPSSPETNSSAGPPTPSRSLSPTSFAGHRPSRHASPSPLRISSTPAETAEPLYSNSNGKKGKPANSRGTDKPRSPLDTADAFEMHSMGDSSPGGHHVPLLSDKTHTQHHGSRHRSRRDSGHANGSGRTQAPDQLRRKYIYAAFFLLLSLVSFVVQTETAVYIQHELHWNKAYCMLWLTHGSWSLLWPVQLLLLRLRNRKQPWSSFWRKHKSLLRTTAQMVLHQDLHLSSSKVARTPWPYMIKTTAYVTSFLTFAGASWYVAVNLTSPSDLTAIYNCSAFFAYVFSILLLKDKPRLDKIFSVGLAIAGVLVVAYGDTENPNSHPKTPGHSGGSTNPNSDPDTPPDNRLAGNLIIGIGSVLYGLYEVLYKKYACPPEGTSPNRGMLFANTFGSMVGVFTLTVLWIPLPILHYTGLETFELPRGQAAYLLFISTLSNAVFSGSFLVLMSLTSPVLSSVAALLTIFLVAITDWMITGKPLSAAALGGGTLIIIAFLMLSWATYREMKEEAIQREIKDENKASGSGDDDDDEEEEDLADSNGNRAYERQALVEDDELDSAERARRTRGRSNSAVVVRGDESDWDEDEDDGDVDEIEAREAKKRRHRNS